MAFQHSPTIGSFRRLQLLSCVKSWRSTIWRRMVSPTGLKATLQLFSPKSPQPNMVTTMWRRMVVTKVGLVSQFLIPFGFVLQGFYKTKCLHMCCLSWLYSLQHNYSLHNWFICIACLWLKLKEMLQSSIIYNRIRENKKWQYIPPKAWGLVQYIVMWCLSQNDKVAYVKAHNFTLLSLQAL